MVKSGSKKLEPAWDQIPYLPTNIFMAKKIDNKIK